LFVLKSFPFPFYPVLRKDFSEKHHKLLFWNNGFYIKQEPVEQGDAPQEGFGHMKLLKNKQRAKTPKLGKAKLWLFALHFYPIRSIYLQSCMLISLIVLELNPGKKVKK
jgi:hypothetical protein